MFKRIFFLSGIIALFLTCALMWFWYLPQQEQKNAVKPNDTEVVMVDTVSNAVSDTLIE